MPMKTSGIFLVSAVAASFFSGATAAHAAPTTLLGVYEEYVGVSCKKGVECFVFFSTVPAATKISKVSCNFYINAGNASLTGVALGQAATASPAQYHPAQYVPPVYQINYGANLSQYQFLADTQHVVPKGMKPAIEIGYNTSATSVANCSISGTTSALLPATQ